MKKLVVCALLLMSITGTAHARLCFQDTIKEVHVGRVANDFDGGMAIYFHTTSGAFYMIDNVYNMNDPQGKFMYYQLMLSVLAGYKLKGFDNWNDACDKINQITLMK